MRNRIFTTFVAVPLMMLAACATATSGVGAGTYAAGRVDDRAMRATDNRAAEWISAGRTYSEQRYSPLTQINRNNIDQLSLAWYGDIDTQNGQESTPVVVDGVLYLTTSWSHVKAYDAVSGEKLWEYNPNVDPAEARNACCDVVNRGVAVWEGKVIVGVLDGRLVALDSKTGEVVWSVQTTPPDSVYTITQTPRVANGKVFIGNAGAEYDVRGYVSAYDVDDGSLIWRFFTVPGDPSKPFEHAMMEEASKTWNGEWWKMGGGATAWDSIVYDPETNLLYFGTGNGLAWAQELRSPGGGDNLFVSSIIAVDADSGQYRWHFQETPGDEWDFDNTNPLMTADLMIDGKMRHVLMQAPKQAFFYVWDAATGELLRADQFAPQNWALEIEVPSGRPVINPAARYSSTGEPVIIQPGALGAHNWHPMSFSPRTGLVYIPVQEQSGAYAVAEDFEFRPGSNNIGLDRSAAAGLYDEPGAIQRGNIRSYLQAWDPVAGKEVWRYPNEIYGSSGTMVTASDLVFMGNQNGEFSAYDARTGERVWNYKIQARVMAAPSTYMIDGVQYVALLVGSRGLPPGQLQTNPDSRTNARILVFKLGGTAQLPTEPVAEQSTLLAVLDPPPVIATAAVAAAGEQAYQRNCSLCHGDGGVADKSAPDLRYTRLLRNTAGWNAVVLEGARAENGMPGFDADLADGESESILAYIVAQANQAKREMDTTGGH